MRPEVGVPVHSPTTDQALQRLLAQGRARAAATDPDHTRLWDALGRTAFDAAAMTGAAVELLHTVVVIHDDVIDGDDLRRGRPNVSGTYYAYAVTAGATPDEADALGRTDGTLAGDLALAAAIRAVATCGASPDVTHRLLDLFDAALHTTAAGELADVRLSLSIGVASLPESLTMEEQKTSAYSFALPLQAGAVLAGVDDRTVGRLGEAGRTLGIAFQLIDDLLGVGRDLTDDELSEARRLVTASGSHRSVEELVDALHIAARTVVEELDISADLLAAVITCTAELADGNEVAA